VHTPAHPLTDALVRTAIEETQCVIGWCRLYGTGSGQSVVEGCCEYGDEQFDYLMKC
jgi:hypothetical protein